MGCPLTMSTVGTEPFVIYTDNQLKEDGSIAYNVTGLFIEPFLIPFQKMNFTMSFLPPVTDYTEDVFPTIFMKLLTGLTDIIVGLVPRSMYTEYPATKHTIPHTIAYFTMFTPCPSRMQKMSKVLSVFTLPVWLSLALAFVLTSAVFWCFENITHNSTSRQLNFVTSISLPFHNAWAILMGVSVPKMPNKWNERFLFLVYVCYCLATVTVFQAFFVSYLVEPGYGKPITTVDEAVDEGLFYGDNPYVDQYLTVADYKEHQRFPKSRHISCTDLVECTKRLIIKRDTSFINAHVYERYIASTIGVSDYTKALCHISDALFISIDGLLIKGNLFYDRLNKLMRQCIEGGLVNRYWAHLNFEARLHSSNEYIPDTAGNFFAFEISHLSAAFILLASGYIFSFIVFVWEITRNGLANNTLKCMCVRRTQNLQRV
jgi:hypothetical protein